MNRGALLALGFLIVIPAVALLCLVVGGTNISLFNMSDTDRTIIFDVRLPRILTALLVGAGLAACGCVLQAILRNPLADPYTLGISGGAAVGVTALLAIGPVAGLVNALGSFGLPLTAFAGALAAVGLVFLIASKQRFSVHGLILSGVILSFIFSGIVMLIFAVSKPTEIQSAMFWLMGNLANINYTLMLIVGSLILTGIIIAFILAKDMDVMTLGDEKAVHLGVSPQTTRRTLFIITSLITGACVAVSGIIGFVGLMIPHIMRLIVGPSHRMLLINSVLAGALFLAVTDTLARTIMAPNELPVGVITGIIGGVFFISLLMKKTV
ncbi:MAG: iron ABC transporter permease [Candidatus Brocadiia bacterium]